MRDPVRLLTWLSVLLLVVWQPVAGQQQPGSTSPGSESPSFLWGLDDRLPPAGGSAESSARWHLERSAERLGASRSDLAQTEVIRSGDTGSDGVVVHLRQRVGGVLVYGSDIKVLMRANHQLIAISGRPSRADAAAPPTFVLSAEQALATAVSAQTGVGVAASSFGVSGDPLASGARRVELTGAAAIAMPDPAVVTPVLFPSANGLTPAFVVDFYAGAADSSDAAAFRYIVAAADGAVLERHDLTITERAPDPPGSAPQFTYRVVTDDTGRPLDGPQEDFTPHPTGTPDGVQPALLPQLLVTTGGFNGFPTWKSDPWLPADATETNGNNADAYVDYTAPDGFTAGDFRAGLTSAGTFDYIYDHSLSPVANQNQSKAAITNAFHLVNWLHDYWYGSGFNEAAGNAQRDNYGRGGEQNDSMRVEVQDAYFAGARNNANMSTPGDGLRPRMQIFAWSGPTASSLTLTPGGSVAIGLAQFGPTNFNVTGTVALANDGVPVVTNACEPLVGPVVGKIVLADRGVCSFLIKAQRVQAAGGIGVIIANNAPGAPPGLAGVDPAIVIPVMSITQADGAALKTALTSGPVTATMFRFTGVEREGALDNGLVAHEWGHYMHHRLTSCTTKQCGAMSEGWGDFTALHLLSREQDNLNGTYATAYYAFGQYPNAPYDGLRRVPYSIDFSKSPLTFKHIADGEPLPPQAVPIPGTTNSEVHNAGEIWASALWEGYIAIQQTRKPGRTFEDVRRRMTDYVVDGLQLAPVDATFTETRDAILAASLLARPGDSARDRSDARSLRSDAIELARAFARRGLGTCAVSPARNSTNFVGVVENFDVKPKIELGAVRVEEGSSCDHDGVIDAGESGQVVIPILNAGPLDLLDTTVTVTTSTPGVSFPKGSSVRIRKVAPFSSTEVVIEIAVGSGVSGISQLELQVQVSNGEACDTDVSAASHTLINTDTGSSATDTVESPASAWTASDAEVWSRVQVAPFQTAWLGADSGVVSDTHLTSPALSVSATLPFAVSFDHRHSFELSDANYDGGVIEISVNGGAWQDVSAYAAPGYGGVLFTDSGNPLGGRNAFVGANAAFPARNSVTLNFGNALAGQTVRLRFRIGTDAAVADMGWEIDNIAASGITNLPFTALVADTTVCKVK